MYIESGSMDINDILATLWSDSMTTLTKRTHEHFQLDSSKIKRVQRALHGQDGDCSHRALWISRLRTREPPGPSSHGAFLEISKDIAILAPYRRFQQLSLDLPIAANALAAKAVAVRPSASIMPIVFQRYAVLDGS